MENIFDEKMRMDSIKSDKSQMIKQPNENLKVL